MSDPELDLGLPPSEKKARQVYPERPVKGEYSWRKYVAKSPRFCDHCVRDVEKVKGVPKNAVNHARHIEDGPDGRYWLCEKHMQDRKIAKGYSGNS